MGKCEGTLCGIAGQAFQRFQRQGQHDIVLALGQDLPAERLRPELGQIVSVDDDVVESDGHVASMRAMMDCLSLTRSHLTR